jgi:hypothetical protein
MNNAAIEKESPEATSIIEDLAIPASIDALEETIRVKAEPARNMDPEALLDTRIEVSPFIELTNEWGDPIWIRKSAIVGVKVGNHLDVGRSRSDGRPRGCTIITVAGDIAMADEAVEIIDALGAVEL